MWNNQIKKLIIIKLPKIRLLCQMGSNQCPALQKEVKFSSRLNLTRSNNKKSQVIQIDYFNISNPQNEPKNLLSHLFHNRPKLQFCDTTSHIM